jgi:hypothetical protein
VAWFLLQVAQRLGKPRNQSEHFLMLTALILVCSLASVPDLAACTEQNARVVLRDPETFTVPSSCLMHGQAYLAESAIGRELGENEAVKVLCLRSRTFTTNSETNASTALAHLP